MPSASSSRKGFTLFELLLVIALIAVIYGVFISKLTARPSAAETMNVTVETLGEYLQTFAQNTEGDVELICRDRCLSCDVYAEGKRVDDATVAIFDSAPVVYRKDRFGQFQETEFLPLKNKEDVLEKVCFRYTLFENGSRSSYILAYKDTYYLMDPYLEPVKTFRSLEAAETAYNKTGLIPDDQRSYDF